MAGTECIHEAPQTREELFINLYKNTFPPVAKYVSTMGGSFDEAKDVFQDALIVYYEKGSRDIAPGSSREQAYVLGIAKHLWIKQCSENKKTNPLDDLDITDIADAPISNARLLRAVEKAGKKCLELLTAFYYDKTDLAQIATVFGFSGLRSATVQKYKCLEKVRDHVKERSLSYADFTE